MADVIEDVGATWGAVYLRGDLGADPATACAAAPGLPPGVGLTAIGTVDRRP